MKEEVTEEMTLLTQEKRKAVLEGHIRRGAIIPCTDGVIIGERVRIEKGAVILKGSILLADSVIGAGAVIGPDCLIVDSTVSSGAKLNAVQCFSSFIDEDADIGPFVHIRPGSRIGRRVHLGNFVEVKNSVIDERTKVSHLSYVGDSDIGKGVNFGCGCVTVNFDGKTKHRTEVEDAAFLGCHTKLIAPVRIGKRAYTAAGTTVTEDVPPDALAIGRARQVNKEDWVKRKSPYRE